MESELNNFRDFDKTRWILSGNVILFVSLIGIFWNILKILLVNEFTLI